MIAPTIQDFCKQLELHILLRTSARLRGLSIHRTGTTIRLAARADTWYLKQLAIHAAMEYLGCETGFELEHEITVG
jgi:hypothetical protein